MRRELLLFAACLAFCHAFEDFYHQTKSTAKSHEVLDDAVHLKYDVEPAENVKTLSLDNFLSESIPQTSLTHISCSSYTASSTSPLHSLPAPPTTPTQSLSLHFETPTQAEAFVAALLSSSSPTTSTNQQQRVILTATRWVLVNTLLAQSHPGLKSWSVPPSVLKIVASKSGCFESESDSEKKSEVQQGLTNLMRWVNEVTHVRGTEVVLGVSQASYNDIFRDAVVSFVAHKLPERHFQVPPTQTQHGADNTHVRPEVFAIGDMNYSQPFTIGTSPSFNYNPSTQSAAAPIPLYDGLSCDNCYVVMHAPILTFSINITAFKLNSMSLVLDLAWEAQLSAYLNKNWQGDLSNSVTLPTVNLPPIIFMVMNIPFEIDVTIPITVGFNAHFTANIEIRSFVKGVGRLAMGVRFDGTQLVPVMNDRVTWTGNLARIYGTQTTQLTLWVEPNVIFQVNNIGRVNVDFRPSLEILSTISNKQVNNACAGRTDLTAAMAGNVGLLASIGAAIEVKLWSRTIYAKQWPDHYIVNLKVPVPAMSGCIKIANTTRSRVVIQPGLVPFMAWSGRISYGGRCVGLSSDEDNDRASIQLVSLSDDGLTAEFTASMVVFRANDSMPCLSQARYQGAFSDNRVKLIPYPDQNMATCLDGSQSLVEPWILQGARCVDQTWSQWKIADVDCKCVNVDLYGANAATSQCPDIHICGA